MTGNKTNMEESSAERKRGKGHVDISFGFLDPVLFETILEPLIYVINDISFPFTSIWLKFLPFPTGRL